MLGTSACPSGPVPLAGHGLLTADVWFSEGLCCSTDAEVGDEAEEEEEEEEGRGRSGDEVGGVAGFSFSIMVVKPQRLVACSRKSSGSLSQMSPLPSPPALNSIDLPSDRKPSVASIAACEMTESVFTHVVQS